jgi:hypothetical protein
VPYEITDFTFQFLDGDFTTPLLVGLPRKVYPIEGDTSIYLLEEDYAVFTTNYEPLTPASRHPDYPHLYYVKDTPIRPLELGQGAYTRVWSSLPGYNEDGSKTSYVSVDWTSYVFQVPGIANAPTGSFDLNNAASGYNDGARYILTTDGAHDLTAGDYVSFDYYLYDPISKGKLERSVKRVCKAGTAGTTVVMASVTDINTITPLAVYKSAQFQLPYQKNVSMKTVTDYWLPGVTGNINTPEDIPLLEPFSITDLTTGARTEYLGTLTTPTLAAYTTKIDEAAWMVIDCTLNKWTVAPIIYERVTRYVRYQL